MPTYEKTEESIPVGDLPRFGEGQRCGWKLPFCYFLLCVSSGLAPLSQLQLLYLSFRLSIASFSTLDRVSFWVSLRQEILSIHGYWLQWVARRPLHLLPSQGRRMSHSDWSILRTLTFFKSLQDIDGCGRYTSPFLLITSCSWSSGTSCPSGIIIFATLSNQHSLLLCISRLYAYHGCSICPRSPVCVPSLFGGKSITPKAYYLLFLSIL